MGVVWLALHVALDRRVAVKFLLPEALSIPRAEERFLREARAAARIDSDYVARVLDLGTTPDGLPFLVLEHLVGMDLHDLLLTRGPLSIASACSYVAQAATGLSAAHALSIVHRDLKPGNLFLSERDKLPPSIKVLDFGIAKVDSGESWALGALTTVEDALMGSPLYMAPEQIRDTKAVDARVDVWALGVVLFELLTGRHPFEARSAVSCAARIITGEPTKLSTLRPDAPEALGAVIEACLVKDPAQRLASMGALLVALEPFTQGSESQRRVLVAVEKPLEKPATSSTTPITSTTQETRVRSTFDPAQAIHDPRPSPRESTHVQVRKLDLAPSAPTVLAPAPPISSSRITLTHEHRSETTEQKAPKTEREARTRTSATSNFRRQHDELVAMAAEIIGLLVVDNLAVDAAPARRLVARFAGKLAIHSTMENEALYPRLLKSNNLAVREQAKTLYEEVKRIYDSFAVFAKRWPSPSAIEQNPKSFVDDTKAILKLLGKRMLRENQELYPLVDALE